MQYVLASNREHNVFNIGFNACNSYATGLEDMARVNCPVTFVLGSADQMTPPKAARSLISAAGKSQVFTLPAGHSLMTEAPDGVLRAIQAAVKGMSQVRVSA
jgi:pimeloyl-ACP methyl ester carboxylesterase